MIAKCGSAAAPHLVKAINGVGVCEVCKAKFIDNVRKEGDE